MDIRIIGRRLRAVRVGTGFNELETYASLIDFPVERYRALEAGRLAERDLPLGVLHEISRVTNTSLDFLLTGRAAGGDK